MSFLSFDGSEASGNDSSKMKFSFLCFFISVKSRSWYIWFWLSLKADGKGYVQISHLKSSQTKELTALVLLTVLFFYLSHLLRQLKWIKSLLHAHGQKRGLRASLQPSKQILHLSLLQDANSSFFWISCALWSSYMLSEQRFFCMQFWMLRSLTTNSVLPNLITSFNYNLC